MSQPARAVYELNVIVPGRQERIGGSLLGALAELIGSIGGGGLGPGGSAAKVTLQVIELSSDTCVLEMREFSETSQGVAELLASDLDQLDAETFASSWGIRRSPE